MERLSVRIASLAAFAAVLAIDVLYAAIIRQQGGSYPSSVPYFVSTYLVAMAALTAAALVPSPWIAPLRVPLRAGAAAGLLVLGLLAAFSIGVPVLIAAALVVVALVRTRDRPTAWWTGAAACGITVLVLLAGFQLTEGMFF